MYLRFTNFRPYAVAFLVLLLSVIVIPTTLAQSQNLCRESFVLTIEYGDTVTGEIDDDYALGPIAVYCFEAERGDTVIVTVEPIEDTGRLIPSVLITEPVIESDQDLFDNALGGDNASRPLGDVEVTVSIDTDGTYLIVIFGIEETQGEFDLTLEVEEGQSILAPDIDNSDDEEDESDDNSTSSEEIILGETNLCSIEGMVFLEDGGRLSDVLTPDFPQALFCIEGNEGDIVQIRVGTASGRLVPFVMLGDPFFDGTSDTIYTQGVASSRSDTAQIIFELPQDGNYFVFVGPTDDSLGEFYIEYSIVDEESPSLGCENEPLNTLSRYPWRISSDAGEETSITFYVTCTGIVLVDVLGADFILEYSFNRDDELSFIMGDETNAGEALFTTVSVDEDNWVLMNDDGEEVTLTRLDIESCSDESLLELTFGVWLRDGGDLLAFDFMCDYVVVILVNDQVLVDDYTIEDGELIISPDTEQEINLGTIEIDGNELILVQDEGVLQFTNIVASDDSADDDSTDDDASDDSTDDDASDDSTDDDASDDDASDDDASDDASDDSADENTSD